MKIKINSKDLVSIQEAALQYYRQKPVHRLNVDAFLANCYLLAVVGWLQQKELIKLEIEDEQTTFESLNDE